MSSSYMSMDDLHERLEGKINSLDLNRILSAYEMSEKVYENRRTKDGTSYFFHSTRICQILLEELKVQDPDLIISSLLHDAYDSCVELNSEIISYNFGPYVALLMELLHENICEKKQTPNFPEPLKQKQLPCDDFMIIRMADQLDNIRMMDFSLQYNPIEYLNNVNTSTLPQATKSTNKQIKYLHQAIVKERNKIYD